jgi:hypothetical protein
MKVDLVDWYSKTFKLTLIVYDVVFLIYYNWGGGRHLTGNGIDKSDIVVINVGNLWEIISYDIMFINNETSH